MSDKFYRRNDNDEWYSTESLVNIIVPYLHRGGYRKILCPFDKAESNFVKVLEREGFDVTYSHIDDGIDFFNIKNLQDYDAIVSNPPFSKRDDIYERLYQYNVPFAMVANMNGLFDSHKRWEIFAHNDFTIIVPKGRIRYINPISKAIFNSPSFQSVYICRGMTNKQIEFAKEERT